MIFSEPKIRHMLDVIRDLQREWRQCSVLDVRDLVKVHETRSMLDCAELVYLSALDRTESRENFYREDFPYTDNDTWFCLHTARLAEQGYQFDRVPIAHTPPRRRVKSPIAASMTDDYRAEDYD
jgi:succinate dehydrogenase/fumarate reductase flavoprotein subunit